MRRRRSESKSSATLKHQPLDLIDSALSKASRARLVSRAEALQTLHDVEAAVVFSAPNATINEIIASAASSYSDHSVIDRGLLVNPLLDIRLAVSGLSRPDGVPQPG